MSSLRRKSASVYCPFDQTSAYCQNELSQPIIQAFNNELAILAKRTVDRHASVLYGIYIY